MGLISKKEKLIKRIKKLQTWLVQNDYESGRDLEDFPSLSEISIEGKVELPNIEDTLGWIELLFKFKMEPLADAVVKKDYDQIDHLVADTNDFITRFLRAGNRSFERTALTPEDIDQTGEVKKIFKVTDRWVFGIYSNTDYLLPFIAKTKTAPEVNGVVSWSRDENKNILKVLLKVLDTDTKDEKTAEKIVRSPKGNFDSNDTRNKKALILLKALANFVTKRNQFRYDFAKTLTTFIEVSVNSTNPKVKDNIEPKEETA